MPAPDQVLPEFGKFLREARERSNFGSQAHVAAELQKLNVFTDPSRITHYEGGRIKDPNVGLLLALASLYKLDAFELLFRLFVEKYRLNDAVPLKDLRWEAARVATALPRPLAFGSEPLLASLQLEARIQFLQEPNIQVLNVEGIAEWQRTFPALLSLWVIASDFLDDEVPVLTEAVKANVARGVEYTYFIIDGPNRRARLDAFLHRHIYPVCDGHAGRVRPSVVLLPSGANNWLHTDHVIANAQDRQAAVGFQSLRHSSKTKYVLRMEQEALKELIDNLTPWKVGTVDANGQADPQVGPKQKAVRGEARRKTPSRHQPKGHATGRRGTLRGRKPSSKE